MDTETWRFINTFAPWLSAIGTILAVISSLYLAYAEKPVKLEIRAGRRVIITQGAKGKFPEFFYIDAINTGHRIVTITNISWKKGFFKKQHAVQVTPKNIYSSDMPIKISDGEEAKWLVPLDKEENWVECFSRDFLLPKPKWNLFWLKLQIHTSTGKTFKTRIEKDLKKVLLEECKKQQEILKKAS